MPQINLLPWRQELRLRRQKEFMTVVGVTLLIMAGAVVGVHMQFGAMIEYQKERNNFLTTEIAALNRKIQKIKDIDQERKNLLARMNIIEELQSSRAEIVHLADELVQRVPEGVYFTKVDQKGAVLTLQGVAQSNARVSSLMRNLDASEYLENPILVEIKVKRQTEGAGLRLADFTVQISQRKLPSAGDDGGNGKDASGNSRG